MCVLLLGVVGDEEYDRMEQEDEEEMGDEELDQVKAEDEPGNQVCFCWVGVFLEVFVSSHYVYTLHT